MRLQGSTPENNKAVPIDRDGLVALASLSEAQADFFSLSGALTSWRNPSISLWDCQTPVS